MALTGHHRAALNMIPGRTLLNSSFVQSGAGTIPDPIHWTGLSGNSGFSGSVFTQAEDQCFRLTTGDVNTNAAVIFAAQNRLPSNIGCLCLWSAPSLASMTWLLGLRAQSTTLTSQYNPTDCYALKPFQNGSVNGNVPSFEIWKVQASSAATIGAGQPLINSVYADGNLMWLRFECVGSLLTGKVWAYGQPESSAIVLQYRDTSFMTGGYSFINARTFIAGHKSVDIYQYVLYEPQTLRSPARDILNIIDAGSLTHYPRVVTLSAKS